MRASAVAGIVFANVNDPLLGKLTSMRSMASIPFGARYRLIDFSLSNLVNAGVSSVGIITKENYRSLMDHVGNGVYWDLDRKNGGLYLLPPYVTREAKRYRGTVDALHGARDYINRCKADYIVLCDANTVANVDVAAALKNHVDVHADVTLVYHHGLRSGSKENGMLLQLGADRRVTGLSFGHQGEEEVSFGIGIVILARALLLRLIDEAYEDGAADFQKDVLAQKLDGMKIVGFEHRDFVAIMDSAETYYEANQKLLNADVRRQLFHIKRPVFTKTRDDMPTRYGTQAVVSNCLIGDGCVIAGTVKNSILFRGVTVERGAVVENCILMQETTVRAGAQISYVMADKNAEIGSEMIVKGTAQKHIYLKKNQAL